MSVKSKVKRCNKEIERLKNELETERLSNNRLRYKLDNGNELLENIVKFAVTNQVGNLRAGMIIDARGVDKMKELKLSIDRGYINENAYIIRVHY